MAGVISEDQLKAKIEGITASITRLAAKRKELESELRVYRGLLAEVASEPVSDKPRTASEAIMEHLGQVESASTKELLAALTGQFHTTGDPTAAIYAAIASLKTKGDIESVPGDARRYRRIDEELEPEVQRAAS